VTPMTPIEQVLDLARWAPSGDNSQPWRFQITGERSCIVHAFDTRRHCVYDLTGGPSQIAVGGMLETARIAATGLSLRTEVTCLSSDDEHPRFELALLDDPGAQPDPLLPYITTRCTHRRPYSRRPLTGAEKATLQASVGPSYTLHWIEGPKRSDMARLLFASAKIRLTIPEAYAVHCSVIEWHSRYSETKIPDQAVGLDPAGLALMRWAMKSWSRTRILSVYLGGTLLPRLQLDLLPGLGCAAHVMLLAPQAPSGLHDNLRAGAAVQRLWLQTTMLGLQHQPEMTPVIFAGYHRSALSFSSEKHAIAAAAAIDARMQAMAAPHPLERVVWLGRVGEAKPPSARSIRRSSADLSWLPDSGQIQG